MSEQEFSDFYLSLFSTDENGHIINNDDGAFDKIEKRFNVDSPMYYALLVLDEMELFESFNQVIPLEPIMDNDGITHHNSDLGISLETLIPKLTQETLLELVRCGMWYCEDKVYISC